MKVYARYFEENGLGFRRDTILQLGDSWDLIGSIILMNPGSAVPISNIASQDVLSQLSKLTGINESQDWKEFSVDPTMRWIETLFSGRYIGENRSLNGVIQLFNLFNLRNQNSGEAIELKKTTDNENISSILEDVKRLRDKPVYLGWGNAGKYHLKEIAKEVFDTIPNQPYLLDKFENNSFYHPRYLQLAHRRNVNVITLLHNFYNQNREYVWEGIINKTKPINAENVYKKFKALYSSNIDIRNIEVVSDNSTIRLYFKDKDDNILEFIVTKSTYKNNTKGYTAIRYKPDTTVVKENSMEYIAIGDKYDFESIPNYRELKNGSWFCKQSFKHFYQEEDELVNLLIKVCNHFLSMRK